MGGLINGIFGGNSNKYYGQALDFSKQVYGENKAAAQPWISGGQGAYQAYNDMLYGPNQDQAFNNWLNSSDYQFTTKAGLDAINQNMASKGLLNSGATLKAITQFGEDNAQQYRNNYMNQLLGSAGIGSGILGNLMGQSNNSAEMVGQLLGQKSTAQANGVGNFLNFGLGVASLISDERLKTDIKPVGRLDKDKGDVGVYSYRYVDDPPNLRRIGVMAQEVAKKKPEALGPNFGNFMTVNYKELVNA